MDVRLQRCFVALIPDSGALDAIDAWRAPWRAGHMAGVRWTPREQIHLTIRFVGALTPSGGKRLIDEWPTLTPVPDRLPTSHAAILPSARRARVYALELISAPAFLAWAARVDVLLERVGVPAAARPLRPHLTLARLRGDPPAPTHDFEAVRPVPPLITFATLALVSSTLTPAGSRYATLAAVPAGRSQA
ncbi:MULTISPECIES: RNA 2',3'-cyclic phosphodiesterase [Burkholderiaceae]|uniref:RNA 2',3'-cyclic phosphodiesterase n=1 Tax=Burkholderiaceae TaxID=119060 RepID=UPI0009649A0C|nr:MULTISPECIES: RNA 2',3'-cyclic phosphodiesterase [Burkholderiaceae]MCF2133366.1 RNA 2',3'-cyclic phosphodiesterase [Mycetohabitans sp. B3]MCG1038919.1 RNA 2',3'-cyclic phosphodiesterase [Mycetohabitans sp. B7]SIT77511.1 2'-5' RNA ligase [Burkholderia sp. b14]